MKNKKKLFHFVAAFAVIACSFLFTAQAQAKTNDHSEGGTINVVNLTEGKWRKVKKSNKKTRYIFSIEENSYVILEYKDHNSSEKEVNVGFYSPDYFGGSAFGCLFNKSYSDASDGRYLKKGTYGFEVITDTYPDDYSIRYTIVNQKSTAKHDNTKMSTATKLKPNKLVSNFCYNSYGKDAWYKIELTEKQYIKYSFNYKKGGNYVEIYNADGDKLPLNAPTPAYSKDSTRYYYWNGKTTSKVKPGTYYIKLPGFKGETCTTFIWNN